MGSVRTKRNQTKIAVPLTARSGEVGDVAHPARAVLFHLVLPITDVAVVADACFSKRIINSIVIVLKFILT